MSQFLIRTNKQQGAPYDASNQKWSSLNDISSWTSLGFMGAYHRDSGVLQLEDAP